MSKTNSLCDTTHLQIANGVCPWCNEHLGGGEGESTSASGQICWDCSAIRSALNSGDEETRKATVTNLLLHYGPEAESALPLLSVALQDTVVTIRNDAERALWRLGEELTLPQAEQFESRISVGQDSLALRIMLLGFYFLGRRAAPSARACRQEHILWIIQHAPTTETAGSPLASLLDEEDEDAYRRARQLWREQIQRNSQNTAILGNAANFLLHCDDELSEQYIRMAQALEPRNTKWPHSLGHLYSLRSHKESSDHQRDARNALHQLETAEDVRLGIPWHGDKDSQQDSVSVLLERMHALPGLAKAAFDAGEFDKARDYAEELLELATSDRIPEFFREDGQAIYDGHLVLGRCAVRNGDLPLAKEHLFAAGQSKGSPCLQSFGPNMTLAKDLLEHGERDAVLQFFDLCRVFWSRHAHTLDEWTAAVQREEMPDFRANLHY